MFEQMEEIPKLIFDEAAGGWKFVFNKWVVSLGWSPQFMRIGNDAVLVSWTATRAVEGDVSKTVKVPFDKEIPTTAVVLHKHPISGVSVMQIDALIGRQLGSVLAEQDAVYGSNLQRI